MYKVKIFSIGKTRESFLVEAIEEYTKRLRPILSIEWVLARENPQLLRLLEKEENYIALDCKGKECSSEEFSKIFYQFLLQGGSRLSFVIGGSEGLPEELKKQASLLLSFSRLTFTHQIVRLILVEQLYRGVEIKKGSPYHK